LNKNPGSVVRGFLLSVSRLLPSWPYVLASNCKSFSGNLSHRLWKLFGPYWPLSEFPSLAFSSGAPEGLKSVQALYSRRTPGNNMMSASR
ncbi:hypothetical protein, partial [Roseibium hamelinense]|uniref:hypothetical protein n=1 Tax=Roseibium hamelinense TaxID=150831 RepID=UPI001AD9011D